MRARRCGVQAACAGPSPHYNRSGGTRDSISLPRSDQVQVLPEATVLGKDLRQSGRISYCRPAHLRMTGWRDFTAEKPARLEESGGDPKRPTRRLGSTSGFTPLTSLFWWRANTILRRNSAARRILRRALPLQNPTRVFRPARMPPQSTWCGKRL